MPPRLNKPFKFNNVEQNRDAIKFLNYSKKNYSFSNNIEEILFKKNSLLGDLHIENLEEKNKKDILKVNTCSTYRIYQVFPENSKENEKEITLNAIQQFRNEVKKYTKINQNTKFNVRKNQSAKKFSEFNNYYYYIASKMFFLAKENEQFLKNSNLDYIFIDETYYLIDFCNLLFKNKNYVFYYEKELYISTNIINKSKYKSDVLSSQLKVTNIHKYGDSYNVREIIELIINFDVGYKNRGSQAKNKSLKKCKTMFLLVPEFNSSIATIVSEILQVKVITTYTDKKVHIQPYYKARAVNKNIILPVIEKSYKNLNSYRIYKEKAKNNKIYFFREIFKSSDISNKVSFFGAVFLPSFNSFENNRLSLTLYSKFITCFVVSWSTTGYKRKISPYYIDRPLKEATQEHQKKYINEDGKSYINEEQLIDPLGLLTSDRDIANFNKFEVNYHINKSPMFKPTSPNFQGFRPQYEEYKEFEEEYEEHQQSKICSFSNFEKPISNVECFEEQREPNLVGENVLRNEPIEPIEEKNLIVNGLAEQIPVPINLIPIPKQKEDSKFIRGLKWFFCNNKTLPEGPRGYTNATYNYYKDRRI